MRLTVVVKIDELWEVVLHNFRQHHTVREVTCNVTLRSAKRNLINPIIDDLKVVFSDFLRRSHSKLHLLMSCNLLKVFRREISRLRFLLHLLTNSELIHFLFKFNF